MSRTILGLCAALAFVSEAFAQPVDTTFTVYGPHKFERAGGSSTTITDIFTLPQGASSPFTMYITNGETNGSHRASGAQIKLNSAIVVQSGEIGSSVPSLTRTVSLIQRNRLEVRLTGSSHSFVSIRMTATDRTPPQLTLSSPTNNLVTSKSKIVVSGDVEDATTVRVTVNGTNVPVRHHGEFSTHVTLTQGSNTITIIAKDAGNNTATATRTIFRDNTPPTLTVREPVNGLITNGTSVVVRGTVVDPPNGSPSSTVTVKVEGVSVSVDGSGNFSRTVSLHEGRNTISVVATDAAKNSVSIQRKITRDTNPPRLSVRTPANNTTTGDSSVTFSGKASDATSCTLVLSLNGGAETAVTLRCMGIFKQKVTLVEGTNTIRLTATDAAGNHTSVTRTVTRRITSLRLIVSAPTDESLTTASSVQVQGTVSGVSRVTVRVNGTPVSIASDGSFSTSVSLIEGSNIVTVTATDGASNTFTIQRLVIRDTTPPVIAITDPDEGFVTKEAKVVVGGTVEDSTSVTVTVNGVPAIVAENGEFTSTATLAEGVNTITVVATDTLGNTVSATRNARKDTTPPSLTITQPAQGLVTAADSILVTGLVTDPPAQATLTVTLDDMPVTVKQDGSFSGYVLLPDQGACSYTIIATDAVGNSTTMTRSVIHDSDPPVFSDLIPADDNMVTADSTITVSALVVDPTNFTLTVNGVPATITPQGRAEVAVKLAEGVNTITIIATDGVGNTTTVTRTVRKDSTPPTLSLIQPANGIYTAADSIVVSGTATDPQPGGAPPGEATVTVNGIPVTVGSDGSFSGYAALPTQGTNTITVVASDLVGNKRTETRTVIRDSYPPAITVSQPTSGLITKDTVVAVAVTVTDSSSITVRANSVLLARDSAGVFKGQVPLVEGTNTIAIVATDTVGNTSTVTRTLRRDTQAPIVNWQLPIDNFVTNTSSVEISGRVADSTAVTLTVNGVAVEVQANGSFLMTIPLKEGSNQIRVVATDAAGNSQTQTRTVSYQSITVPFVITSPIDGYMTNTGNFNIEGKIKGDTVQRLYVSYEGYEWDITWDENGNFQLEFGVWYYNVNTLTVVAQSVSGTIYSKTLTVFLDSEPPSLTTSLKKTTFTKESTITVSGTVTDLSTVTLTVNGTLVPVDTSGKFVCTISLPSESNEITFIATDAFQQSSELVQTVIRDTISPVLTLSSPMSGDTTWTGGIWVEGTVNDDHLSKFIINNKIYRVHPNGSFRYFVMLPSQETRAIVTAKDEAGNIAEETRQIINASEGYQVPDPAAVAPPLNRTVVTNVATSTKFLYTGSNPVQLGVDSGTIEPIRVAVVRGKVIDRAGAPLSGVMITLLGHPEYGITFTRTDGMFDMAVNGGGNLTVNYERENYLPIHRRIDVPWQDYVVVDSVVMVQADPQVTTITLADTVQVARASIMSDKDGQRQAALVFFPNTHAKMVLQSGDTVALPSINVRATEYTVGENGLAAMPAELPPYLAYTYCVELSADEAIAAGATSVQLDRPVSFYVDNFLNLPVGAGIPVGYYDRQKGAWIASQDGRVIKIVSKTNGIADIDMDGDGIAEDASVLAIHDVTLQERESLAKLYAPGQTIWRGQIQHFTVWDFNLCFLDMLARQYDFKIPDLDLENPTPKDGDGDCGSIIEVQSQTLGQSIPINGTPLALRYSTNRVQGKGSAYEVYIPVSDSTLTSDVKEIMLEMRVAGKCYTKSLPAEKSLTTRCSWDGKDAYGRIVRGKQKATIRLGYMYVQTYWVYYPPTGTEAGLSWSATIPTQYDSSMTPFPVRIPKREWRERIVEIGGWDATTQKIGGWEFENHHVYNFPFQTIVQGDGSNRSAGLSSSVINTLSGTITRSGYSDAWDPPSPLAIGPDGSVYYSHMYSYKVEKRSPDGTVSIIAGTGYPGYSGDGGLATAAEVDGITGIAVASDGTVYLCDWFQSCIRKIDPDGIITTIAGAGYEYGEGVPAIQAEIYEPGALALGPDGSLYVLVESSRVRRITPDGIITTYAGNGYWGFSGDGGPAVQAQLGEAIGICVDQYGVLYIADRYNGRIRKVSVDGIITTIAGSGLWTGNDGNGGPAIDAEIEPYGVEVTKNGTIFILDGSRIRYIRPDGIILTLAGTGEIGFSGDNGAAAQAVLNYPDAIKVAPNGDLYFSDGNSYVPWIAHRIRPSRRIRKISLAFSGYTNQQLRIATEDGSQVYLFDNDGRHLRTEDALTGNTIYSFVYNPDGTLSAIRDIDSLLTTIERDSNGNATAIISPYGQRTNLVICVQGASPPASQAQGGGAGASAGDSTGFLTAIIDPANDTTRFSYADGGLMTSLTDPKSNMHFFDYDSIGRLHIDRDPAGGFKQYDRTQLRNGYEILATSAEGRKKRYKVESLPTGGVQMTNTDESGLTTIRIEGRNGVDSVIPPDGTVTTVVSSPDPRFGMQSPLSTVTVRMPAGLTSTVSQSRVISQMSGVQVTGMTERAVVNDRTYTTTYRALEGTEGQIELGRALTDYGFVATAGTFTSIVGQPGTIAAGRGVSKTFSNIPIGFDFLFSGEHYSQVAICTNGWISFDAATTNVNYGSNDPHDLVAASNIYPFIAPLYDILVVNGNIYYRTTGTAPGRVFTVEWNNVGWNYGNRGNSISFQAIFYEESGDMQFVYTPGPDGIIDGGAVVGMANADGLLSVSDLKTSATVSRITENDYIAIEPPPGLTFTFTPPQRLYVSVPAGAKGFFESVTPERRKSFTFIDSRGRVLQERVPGVEPVTYGYDPQGRLVQATQGGRVSSFTYDSRSRLATATDPLMRTTSFEYDAVGRITRQTLPDGKEIAYSYDSNSNLTSLTPPGKPAHLFDYTAVNLTKRYLPPLLDGDTTATGYLYNLDRQITSTLRPDGINVAVEYDTVGCGTCGPTARPKTITFDRGQLGFFYHPTSGLLSALTAPGGNTLSYTYDGSLPTSVQWNGQVAGTVGVTYDKNFRVTQQTVNGGNEVDYQYDQEGLLTQAGDMSITRDPQNGRITSTQLGNVTTSQTYNGAGELESYQAKFGSNVLFQTHYVRDSLGRISELTETVQGNTKVMRYGYDVAGRLEKVWRNDTLISTYSYDANGNRLSHTSLAGTVNATYDEQDRLLTHGSATYGYTLTGDLAFKTVGSDSTRYFYDALGSLVRAHLPHGDVIDYVVDGQNRRVVKRINGRTAHVLLYENQLHPIAELDSLGNVTSRFTYATKGNVPEYIVKAGKIYRVITDHLGSVLLVVDQTTGVVEQTMAYGEFGDVLYDSNPGFQPFGFAGGLYDTQTKLIRFGARDYDAGIGRWARKDPIRFLSDDVNLYAYCLNDPLNWIDLLGFQLIPANLPGLGNSYLDQAFAPMVQNFISNAAKQGVSIQFTSAYRTPERQAMLRRSGRGITPAELSLHSAGFAVDVMYEDLRDIPCGLTKQEQRATIRQAAEDAALSWGGNFGTPDPVHFYHDPGTDRATLIDNATRRYQQWTNPTPLPVTTPSDIVRRTTR
jgi:RHS repeat-associated protein